MRGEWFCKTKELIGFIQMLKDMEFASNPDSNYNDWAYWIREMTENEYLAGIYI